MSVDPSQNSLKPSPVPGPSTDTSAPGLTPMKSSAANAVIGSTVEDPEMMIDPFTEPPPATWSTFLVHAPAVRPTRAITTANAIATTVRAGVGGRNS